MYGPIVRMRDKAVVDDTENTVSLVTLAPLQVIYTLRDLVILFNMSGKVGLSH